MFENPVIAGTDSLFFSSLLLVTAVRALPQRRDAGAWAASGDPRTLGSSRGARDRSPFCWECVEGGVGWRQRQEVGQPSAVLCPPLRSRPLPSPRPRGGLRGPGSSGVLPTDPAEGRGRRVTLRSGISSLAAAELAGKTLHKKRLQSVELGGRARSAPQPAAENTGGLCVCSFPTPLSPGPSECPGLGSVPWRARCSWQLRCFGGGGKGSLDSVAKGCSGSSSLPGSGAACEQIASACVKDWV